MFRTKTCKIILACACLMAILLPYATPVLAAAKEATYKQSDLPVGTKINLVNLPSFPHKSSYTINDADGSKHIVYNICVKKDANSSYDRTNAIYCLNGEKTFPGFDANGNTLLTPYQNFGNFFDITDNKSEVYKYVFDATEGITEKNYNSICWIINNCYLEYQDDEKETQYNKFLNDIFADYLKANEEYFGKEQATKLDDIKSMIDYDDINSLQQIAIWYFSNNGFLGIEEDKDFDKTKYKNGYNYADPSGLDKVEVQFKLPSIEISKFNSTTTTIEEEQLSPSRVSVLNMILSYLLVHASNAQENNIAETIIYPELTNKEAKVEIEGNNYKVGPFEITSSKAAPETYNITLTDGEKELTAYELKTAEKNEKINTLKDTVGKTFYVYVPVPDTAKGEAKLTNIKLGIEYLASTTNASYWQKVGEDGKVESKYQPAVWITKDLKEAQYKEVIIEESDLALRKYIVSVNGNKSVARTPKVDATALLDKTKKVTDATYKHKKSPIEVSAGDKIVYEIRVYNEGNTSATVKKITDFIPNGLELVSKEASEINSKYNWTVKDGVAVIELNSTLKKIDAKSVTENKDTITGGLDSVAVQIELKVKDGLKADSVLTNVAEINDDNILDRDSNTNSIKKEDIKDSFSGNKDNDSNLDNPDNFYKGLEDDDDFEKVKVEGKVFDLALKKFITSVNGEKISREPKVDVSTLSTSTNAKYTMDKTPVVVEPGDIVTYKLRVYNEGEMDGFAEIVADYIPEGLGFIVDYKLNDANFWSITDAVKDGAKVINLSEIKNGTKNLKVEDFVKTTSLDDVKVVKGLAKIKSDKLSSDVSANLIKGFDAKKDKTLAYKDIEVACIVLAEEPENAKLKNIAEIVKNTTPDSEGKPQDVVDRDSEPDSVKPGEYPSDSDKKQDDHDYEDLAVEDYVYDLALQKFITAVNDEKITNRAPTVTLENDKIRYNHSSEPQEVGNGDLVEYTLRVYNEGNKAAYAAEIADDLPNGLKFVADNETNIEYGWVLVDKNGEETKDINQAKTVRTDYLSKEASEKRKEDCLLKAFDPTKPISTDSENPNPDYRDVKIVFKVDESVIEKTTTTEKRIIKNIAEITEETDEDGDEVVDEDSTPDNWKEGEDDIDKEQIYVKYFDLSLKKDLVKVIVMENGTTTEYSVSDDQLFKVEINKKKIKSTVVKFVYNITVKNDGEIDGYAKEIKDYIPEGLEFVADENKDWYKLSDNVIATDALSNTLLKANGGTASVQVTLKWINGESNLNKKVNVAEISKDDNEYDSPDIDSTPDNKVPGEDDIDDAQVILSISTGASQNNYGLIVVVAVIMITGVALIKKFVL